MGLPVRFAVSWLLHLIILIMTFDQNPLNCCPVRIAYTVSLNKTLTLQKYILTDLNDMLVIESLLSVCILAVAMN